MLVERSGELVTREEIKKKLWPNDTVVEFDDSIHTAMKKLRQALGDAADNPKYVETVARRGYRLIVPVECLESTPGDGSPSDEASSSADGAAAKLQLAPAGLTGRTVSHYRVLDVIGGGGMGVVYRAEDLKLGRCVALKFLPEELGSDPHALERFSREARAASSLDHPNICAIHEFGEHEGRPFMVMQLLEGQTLRDRLADTASEGALLLQELLEIGIQVSDGLQAAHEKGIIHRDIKPANIFITNKGLCKILDFGLVKLLEADQEDEVAEARDEPSNAVSRGNLASTALTLTRTGLAMGTAGYMSPEQVRGEKLDARTDLFSFGLILYEMATGQRAFSGETAAILKDAILNHTPVPVHDLNSTLPPKLVQAIDQALEKDRELRYQSAQEMRADLQSLALQLPGQSDIRVQQHGYRRGPLLTAALGAMVLTASVVYMTARRQPSARPGLKQTQLTANSSANAVVNGAISPDGKYLAYYDQKGIHLKLLETGETRDVTEPEALTGSQHSWEIFPWNDTKFLADAFVLGGGDSAWIVSVMGGAPRKLRDDAFPNSLSPDGSTIAFLRSPGSIGDREIWLMDSDGEQARKVYQTDEDSNLQTVEWSPDGQRLAYWKEHRAGDKLEVSIETLDLSGGPSTTLISDPRLWQFVWLRDGRLIYSLAEPDINQASCNLWALRVDGRTGRPAGTPLQLTDWAGFCTGDLSATQDSKRLVTFKWWNQRSVYVADYARSRLTNPRRLTLSDGQEYPVGWTADGKSIVFVSNRNGTWGIFKQALNKESAETIVTGLPHRVDARMSPDSSWILYQMFTGWTAGRLMRVPVTGGPSELVLTIATPPEPIGLAGVHLHEPPRCARSPAGLCAIAERTADGKQLVFTGFDPVQGRGSELTRFDIDPTSAYKWDLSPEGDRIAVLKRSDDQVHILSLIGQPERLITVKGWRSLETVDWAVDSKGLFTSDAKEKNSVLLYVDLQGNANVLWEQPGEQEGNNDIYAIPSSDGHHLAMFGWTRNSNMWMLENF